MIKTGDVLRRNKGFVDHVGVAVDSDFVFHSTPEDGEHVTTLNNFADGQDVRVEPGDFSPLVFSRLSSRVLNPKPYSYLNNNCEHLASWVKSGNAKSRTVRLGIGIAITFGIVWVLRKS